MTKPYRFHDVPEKRPSGDNQYPSILGYISDFSKQILRGLENGNRGDNRIKDVVTKAERRLLVSILKGYGGRGCRVRVDYAKSLLNDIDSARRAAGFRVHRYGARLASQGLVGVGSGVFDAVFEVGLSWHPFLDVPYYPGSSIKGSVRNALEDLAELSCSGDSRRGRCMELVERVFGCCTSGRESGEMERGIGVVEFDDMLPVDCGEHGRLLDSSIITPHYFSGGKPVRWEYEARPNPVLHLAIARGVVFQGVVSIRPGGEKHVLELAKELIGLQTKSVDAAVGSMLAIAFEYGVGARSAKGYNVFELIGP